MRITRTLAVALAPLLIPVAIATAAPAGGVYSGNLKFNNGYRNTSFALKATFRAGVLTRLYGQGNEYPYKKRLSNAMSCGAVNIYDTKDASEKGKYPVKITGTTRPDGSFAYVLTGKFHDTVTFSGRLTAKHATGNIRFFQSHLYHTTATNGHCDTGLLPVTLTK